jgi:hypothetical protein
VAVVYVRNPHTSNISANCICAFNGERRERDKGMKGINDRMKRTNDEDNGRNDYRLNFNGIFILEN